MVSVRMPEIKNTHDSLHWRRCGVRGSLLHCLWEYKLVQSFLKSVWQFLRKLGINLPQDPAITLLDIYPKDVYSCHKDMCSTMFIAALFVIVGTWKQPTRPSNEEWMKKMWYIYTIKYYSPVRSNDILTFSGK